MRNLPLITDGYFSSILTMKYMFTWHCITEGCKSAGNVITDLIIRRYPLISVSNPLHYILKKNKKIKTRRNTHLAFHQKNTHTSGFPFIAFGFISIIFFSSCLLSNRSNIKITTVFPSSQSVLSCFLFNHALSQSFSFQGFAYGLISLIGRCLLPVEEDEGLVLKKE